jgi:thymidylate kinase
MRVLDEKTDILVLDRSFISEMVYGPVVRNNCKLTLEQYTELLKKYKENGFKIVYLTAPKEVLLERRSNDMKDYEIIDIYYEKLSARYEEIMDYSHNYIDVFRYDSFAMSKEEIQNNTKRLMIK